jgi:predicted nucleic acid-binding Zn ribbon protein
MARGRFRSLSQLLPATLEGLAQRAAGEGDLAPAWASAAGATIARVSRPIALRGDTLEIEVKGEAWAKELTSRSAELVARLAVPLGGRVKKLAFRVSNAESP